MSAWDSPIVRVSTGALNTVNDTVIANQAGIAGASKFAGQIGKVLVVGQEQIGTLTNTTIGVLYSGLYQYVQLAAASLPVARGQAAFWDLTVAPGLFRVTDDPTPTVPDGVALAGVFLNPITPGNYGFIQILGQATVQLIASVTDITIGSAIVPSLVASPGNHAMFNAIDDNSGNAAFPVLNAGWAVTAPSNGGLCVVQLREMTVRR